MKIWVIDDGERWTSDTANYGDHKAIKELEADLQSEGHTWRGHTLYISQDIVNKMAGAE